MNVDAPTHTATQSDDELTKDAFLEGRITALQHKTGYRAGIDAVFLAASIPARPGARVMELGLGAGVAALCLLAREPLAYVTGLEIQSSLCKTARANAKRNGFAARMHVIEHDILTAGCTLEEIGLVPGSFDHVYANPPYYDTARVRRSPDSSKARAHSFAAGDLEVWIKLMIQLAAPRASITMIHKADMLGELLRLFDRKMGAIVVNPLHPNAKETASRIVIQGIKGSRAPLALNSGFVLHDGKGGFSAQAKAVLRQGAAFPPA